ncbi:nucleoside diphosphate-linked moiety X motif 17 [Electrophorus electricus]|uniref:m7GpppN-mRNA hydrolase NUDT17 n=1 Tax=Electrophorus electricus TaxID=8005 RepID=A0AAY5E9E0_ELEEL|nr:nucleoside diphosphate-linked moiety X motif 17 [Electrophorus electricus]
MEKVRKVLVHLSKDNTAPQCARFVQSITGHFIGNLDDQTTVNCFLVDNRFILCEGNREEGVPLKRAPFCPIKYLSHSEAASIPPDTLSRGVDVGVAVLLQSANQRVLLTRRAPTLRIFPKVWVPPGGHVELGEKLADAGFRELREETGLSLSPEDISSSRLLGLWESVYPPMLSRGLPQRHHIVTYMLLSTHLTHLQLQSCLRPEAAEVSGCMWLDPDLAKVIVSAVDGKEESVHVPASLPEAVGVTAVSPDGEMRESTLPVLVFCNRAPAQGEDVERVSTGTKYALELWLQTLESHSEKS